jgi:hypothetical protein
MLVKICRYYNYPDIVRQTPNNSFQWDGITFTEDDVQECDYLIILDYPKSDFTIKVNPKNILHIALEPANEISKYRQFGNKKAAVIFNQIIQKDNFVKSQPALPWHLDKDYDYFKKLIPSDLQKQNEIAWVTSNQRNSVQHNQRMNFLDRISNLDFMKIYGRGIQSIDSKWEIMKNAKFAIAYENFVNDFNWTEKIADCFLSYTVPIYYGCTSISNYFPEESYIQLDPKDKHIDLFLSEIVKSNLWEEKLDAIKISRELILDSYQIFPFFAHQIRALQSRNGCFSSQNKEVIHFKGGNAYFDNYPIQLDIKRLVRKVNNKLKINKKP